MKQINERLKEIRQKNKLTQEYIAEYLDTNQSMIWRYEAGITPIPADRLKKLCQLYNISSDYILGLPKGMDYPEGTNTKHQKNQFIIGHNENINL